MNTEILEAFKVYGASLTESGNICKGSKVFGVRCVIKGKRLRFETDGALLASGPIDPRTVSHFVEKFWMWTK